MLVSESSLVKMPHCWKSRVTTHFSGAEICGPLYSNDYIASFFEYSDITASKMILIQKKDIQSMNKGYCLVLITCILRRKSLVSIYVFS